MSDIGSFARLAPSQAQLPVNVYFDSELLEKERQLIFGAGPRYVGHQLSVPEVGDYYALPHEKNGRVLVRSENGVELLSNVCRHRQAIMLHGQGRVEQIVCPLHRWTYDLQGALIGAPHFAKDPCLNLGKSPLQNWNGLLFDGPRDVLKDLQGVPFADFLNFDQYKFHKAHVHECNYNWKSFIEVYMDDYHVVPFHPGLGQFVDCSQLSWHYGDNWSVQAVGITDLQGSGSTTYRKWQDQVLQFQRGELPKFGAIWMTIYPNIMVEWYPNVLVVSTLWPQGPQKTLNQVEFFYNEEVALFEPDYIKAEQDAYMETAIEDDEIAERMDAGRKALMERGISEVGPYHSPMEDGMQHFHEWYRREMKLAV